MNISIALKYINYKMSSLTEHDLHSPFLFNFYNELIKNTYPYFDFIELNNSRKNLLCNNIELEINDFGAGSKKLASKKRKIKDIASSGIAQKKQAEFMYRLLNKFNPKTVIELGTSIGLTTMYMAKAIPKSTIYTIEGCKNIHEFTNKTFKQIGLKNIVSVNGTFDDELPKLLKEINSIDFLYIDGFHTYDATMHYFNMALNKVNSSSIIMFDDINWSAGMQKAWTEICANPKVILSLDFFKFGLIMFREEHKTKEHLVLKF